MKKSSNMKTGVRPGPSTTMPHSGARDASVANAGPRPSGKQTYGVQLSMKSVRPGK